MARRWPNRPVYLGHHPIARSQVDPRAGLYSQAGGDAEPGSALHELTTNASLSGGLSIPAGRVTIVWQRLPPEGDGIEMVWANRRPHCACTDRRGFGSLVIERNLARSLDAEVELAFRPRCALPMLIPATNLAAGH